VGADSKKSRGGGFSIKNRQIKGRKIWRRESTRKGSPISPRGEKGSSTKNVGRAAPRKESHHTTGALLEENGRGETREKCRPWVRGVYSWGASIPRDEKERRQGDIERGRCRKREDGERGEGVICTGKEGLIVNTGRC